jgi:hypothetical protein
MTENMLMPFLNYVAEFRDEVIYKFGYKEYHDMKGVIFRQCAYQRPCSGLQRLSFITGRTHFIDDRCFEVLVYKHIRNRGD